MMLNPFKKKKVESQIEPLPPMETSSELPDDLERFRMRQPEMSPPEMSPPEMNSPEMSSFTPEPRPDPRLGESPVPAVTYGKTVEDLVAERTQVDKIELILQKLETIDARTKLIEEKLKR